MYDAYVTGLLLLYFILSMIAATAQITTDD